jgi:hypothetical protein
MAERKRKRSVSGGKSKQGLVREGREAERAEITADLLRAAHDYIEQLPKYAKEIARRFILEFHPDGETLDEMAFLQWYWAGEPLSSQQIYEKSRKK